MDNHYDTDAAATVLEQTASSRRDALKERANRCIVHLADIKTNDLHITEMVEGRKNWRLSTQDADDNVSDEIVVRLQGVLTRNNLVPKNARSTFDASMASLTTIDQRFRDFLAGTDVMGCSDDARRRGRGFLASNRVFSLRSDVPTEQDTNFHEGVDPVGALTRLKAGELIHAPENIVKYYKRVQTEDGSAIQCLLTESSTPRYESHFPGGFHTGDIVEMQVTFVAIGTGAHKVKVTTRLQALTLLDNQFSKDAESRRELALRGPIGNPAVRRKVGYFMEDEEDERRVKQKKSQSPDGEI
ncbi:hypothetical protein C8R46DRAFT_1038267 [Mycena filopes]|nr:hypothetical protein C8R46DRAFT_1038267 [Mycena filopes]